MHNIDLIDSELLDKLIQEAKQNERLRVNYNFHDSLESPAQMLLNALIIGTKIPIHRHTQTPEIYIVLKGKIDIVLYQENGDIIQTSTLEAGSTKIGIKIPKGQWHTINVIEDAVIFEAKSGPYKSFEKKDIL